MTISNTVVPEIVFPSEGYRYATIQFMDILLECNATGIPAPDVKFFLDSSLLESNESISILDPVNEIIDTTGNGDLVHLVTRRLLISPALDGDSNNYTCVATNANGTDSVVFELIVWGKPIQLLSFSQSHAICPSVHSGSCHSRWAGLPNSTGK